MKYPKTTKDMSDKEYADAEGIRSTLVKNFLDGTPFAFYKNFICPGRPPSVFEKPTAALEQALNIGSATHCFVLEPHNFEKRFYIDEDNLKRGTIKQRALVAKHKDKTVIKAQEFAAVKKMRDSLFSNKGVKKLLQKGDAEISLFWKEGDQPFKCRFDFLTKENIIIDLKTTKDACPKNFLSSIRGFKYQIQAAFYQRAARKALGLKKNPPFIFISVSKVYPHECAILALGPSTMAQAERDLKGAIEKMIDCKNRNSWPSHGEHLHVLEL